MPRATQGYFYRRAEGRHIPIDDPDHQDAQIYFCWQNQYARRSVCCHTSDLAEAKRRMRLFRGAIPITGQERFLKELVLLGKRAEKDLAALIRKKRPPKPLF